MVISLSGELLYSENQADLGVITSVKEEIYVFSIRQKVLNKC